MNLNGHERTNTANFHRTSRAAAPMAWLIKFTLWTLFFLVRNTMTARISSIGINALTIHRTIDHDGIYTSKYVYSDDNLADYEGAKQVCANMGVGYHRATFLRVSDIETLFDGYSDLKIAYVGIEFLSSRGDIWRFSDGRLTGRTFYSGSTNTTKTATATSVTVVMPWMGERTTVGQFDTLWLREGFFDEPDASGYPNICAFLMLDTRLRMGDGSCTSPDAAVICERSPCSITSDCSHETERVKGVTGDFYPSCSCVCRAGFWGSKCEFPIKVTHEIYQSEYFLFTNSTESSSTRAQYEAQCRKSTVGGGGWHAASVPTSNSLVPALEKISSSYSQGISNMFVGVKSPWVWTQGRAAGKTFRQDASCSAYDITSVDGLTSGSFSACPTLVGSSDNDNFVAYASDSDGIVKMQALAAAFTSSVFLCERSPCQTVMDCVQANTVRLFNADTSFYPYCHCHCRRGFAGKACARRSTATLELTNTATFAASISKTFTISVSLTGSAHSRSVTKTRQSATHSTTVAITPSGTQHPTQTTSVARSVTISNCETASRPAPTATRRLSASGSHLETVTVSLTISNSNSITMTHSPSMSSVNETLSFSPTASRELKQVLSVIPSAVPSEVVAAVIGSASLASGVVAAVDAQTIAIVGMVSCSNEEPHGAKGKRKSDQQKDSMRALSAAAIDNTCVGVLIGNTCTMAIVTLASLLFAFAKHMRAVKRHRAEMCHGIVPTYPPNVFTALAGGRTPHFIVVVAVYFMNSYSVCGLEVARDGWSSSESGLATPGAFAFAFPVVVVAMFPVLTRLFGTRRLVPVTYEWHPALLSRLGGIVLPSCVFGATAMSEQAFGAVFAPYRRLSSLWTIATHASYVAALPMVLATAESGTCASMFGLSASLYFFSALAVISARPRRVFLSDILHGAMLALNGGVVANAAFLVTLPRLSPATAQKTSSGDAQSDVLKNTGSIMVHVGTAVLAVTGLRIGHSVVMFAVARLHSRGLITGIIHHHNPNNVDISALTLLDHNDMLEMDDVSSEAVNSNMIDSHVGTLRYVSLCWPDLSRLHESPNSNGCDQERTILALDDPCLLVPQTLPCPSAAPDESQKVEPLEETHENASEMSDDFAMETEDERFRRQIRLELSRFQIAELLFAE